MLMTEIGWMWPRHECGQEGQGELEHQLCKGAQQSQVGKGSEIASTHLMLTDHELKA